MDEELQFWKYQGTGSDFILIDNRYNYKELSDEQRRKLCNRRFGIGAEGVLEILKSSVADYKLLYYKNNGKLGTLCGNGSRCTVAYYIRKENYQKRVLHFECNDRVYEGGYISNKNTFYIGLPDFDAQDIQQLDRNNYFLNNGSPHHIQFVDNLQQDFKSKGHQMCYGQYGEEGCNINFCYVPDKGQISLITYLRGVDDLTVACGTGSTATALLYHFCRRDENKTNGNFIYDIHMTGGILTISFNVNDKKADNIKLIAPSQEVFKGSICIKQL